ncbi:MAG: adenylosuccinate lyase [Muribaculaceae bacterium]|nr:adenylosuccinate lyase [Muribaculaceae bacterium]
MELTALTAISPVDGRYRSKAEPLANYFSEYATIRYRLLVEIEYFIELCGAKLAGLPECTPELAGQLRKIYLTPDEGGNFSVSEAGKIKLIERTTNHDVKAVEYYIKACFDELGLSQYKEFIHFGLTSQDINNTAFPLMLKAATEQVMTPALERLHERLEELAASNESVPMLARTHGQPASPTALAKELRVFTYRLKEQISQLAGTHVSGKFGGATGNFNAHKVAYPNIEWPAFGNKFLKRIGLVREEFTTQISNYDNLAAIMDNYKRINTIIMDLDRDIWSYISMGYFRQKIKAGEVGSSAMPHKVNPIDFENSEGNIGVANAMFEHLSRKLPVSRLQRDLTDSTVLRNLGVPLAHTLIAVESTLKGLDKLIVDNAAIAADLEDNWAVVAEGIQTILRREAYPNPYETLKALTRTNTHIDEAAIKNFIANLDGISEEVRAELNALSPSSYTGYAN